MKLIPCPACNIDLSPDAPQCPSCGHPLPKTVKKGRCLQCGGKLKKVREAKSEGSGCLITIIGLFLIPVFGIGFLVIFFGLNQMSKVETMMQCRDCGNKTPYKQSILSFLIGIIVIFILIIAFSIYYLSK